MRKPKPPLEKVEQANIIRLIRSLGGTVYVLGTRRRKGDYQGTMQTPGVPDLLAFLTKYIDGEPQSAMMWIEVKSLTGKMSDDQKAFRNRCLNCGVLHLVGTFDHIIKAFVREGYLKPESVPAYRTEGPHGEVPTRAGRRRRVPPVPTAPCP